MQDGEERQDQKQVAEPAKAAARLKGSLSAQLLLRLSFCLDLPGETEQQLGEGRAAQAQRPGQVVLRRRGVAGGQVRRTLQGQALCGPVHRDQGCQVHVAASAGRIAVPTRTAVRAALHQDSR